MAERNVHKKTDADHAQDVGGKVGYCRPPLQTRFKPGQSGNPKGRRAGRPNMKTIIERVLTPKVIEAVLHSQIERAKKGDVPSATLLLTYGAKAGLLDGAEAAQPQLMPSDQTLASRLFENINPELVSNDEMIELSRLAEKIDLGGDVTALSPDDFARLREIVNKGRGKDVTPQP